MFLIPFGSKWGQFIGGKLTGQLGELALIFVEIEIPA